MLFINLIVTYCCLYHHASGQLENRLNKYIRHYEGLSYNTEALHNSHQRAKRALSTHEKTLQLDFQSHGRHFNLRMKKDTSLFADHLTIDVSGDNTPVDTSHIYSGELHGEKNTLTHGSVIDGRFEGFIKTEQGTFYVEPSERYLQNSNVSFHSVIYHEDDIDYPHKYGSAGGCANHSVLERMKRYQMSSVEEIDEEPNSNLEDEKHDGPVLFRTRRATEKEKNTCPLFIQTDYTFFKYYSTKEAVLAQIASHVKAIEVIYKNTDFMGIRDIGFIVKRIMINTTNEKENNPFYQVNIGVEKFLELNSEQNHNDYCLAYIFTDRDFDDGVLGLAWVGTSAGASGGICEKNRLFSDNKRKSLNTGIITVQNFGSHVPPKVSHITFAHEVGHNFGSPHDSGIECTPGESKDRLLKAHGNFIMYARATSGDRINNNKFSVCSIRNMSAVLSRKRNSCFVESGKPICGNGLVEEGEECDCGYRDQCQDDCCHDASEDDTKRCKLKPGKLCSPSQGGCCSQNCTFKVSTISCKKESECSHEGFCSGKEARCPTPAPKADHTSCNSNTQVCIKGSCSGSICNKHKLEECTCPSSDDKNMAADLCHVCCMSPNDTSTCSSTSSNRWKAFFGDAVITLQPGSPCDEFKGYCDVFKRCRLVDADGPLARLKKAIFDPELYEDIADWVVTNWWVVLLVAIGVVLLMAGFVQVCSVHTPSSNPRLAPPKHFSDTIRGRKSRRDAPRQSAERYHLAELIN